MRVNSNVKAGKITVNHNQKVRGLRVKSCNTSDDRDGVKLNHIQTVAR